MRAKQLIPFPRPPKYKATAILFNPGEPPRILPTPLSRLGHVSRDKSSDVQSLLALEELCQIAGRANSSWIRVSTSIARKSLLRFRPCFTELSGVGIFARCSKNKVFVSRDERGRGKWGRKKRRGGIEKRDEIVESGHSLGSRSPFFDVYYYPLFSRFVRSCETTIHNAVVKKNLVFRFRLERYFRIVSYRITFSRVRCPPDKNQNKYENAIIKGETYRKRAREGKYRNRWNSLRCWNSTPVARIDPRAHCFDFLLGEKAKNKTKAAATVSELNEILIQRSDRCGSALWRFDKEGWVGLQE